MSVEQLANKQHKLDVDNIQKSVGVYYQNKYPSKIQNQAEGEPVETHTPPAERAESDQRFSDGIFKQNQQNNSDMMCKLQAAFAGRNKGAK